MLRIRHAVRHKAAVTAIKSATPMMMPRQPAIERDLSRECILDTDIRH
jgi:hypothetical protein